MDKDEEVEPQQSSKAMDEDQQQGVVDDDPYGFLVEQCIIPSAEENQLRSMPLFSPSPSPTPTPTPTPTQQPPSPPPVVKHEQTDDGIDMIMQQQQPSEMDKEKEKEATQNMEVDDEESQSVTKEPTISVESSPPPFENEGFSLQSPPPPPPPTRDEPAIDDGTTTPSPVTGEELKKTIEEKSPLEQNEGLVVVVQSQSPPTKTQPGQTHFVPPRVQPAAAAAVGIGVGVGASSSSSSNPGNPKEEDNTTIDILDVLRSKGFYVPRPRWWRPEGYDKP